MDDYLKQFLQEFDQTRKKQIQTLLDQGWPTHDLACDLLLSDKIKAKVCSRDSYAQNLYAAMCNVDWQENDAWEILKNAQWSCSWRSASSTVADLRGYGSYMDWYCSGIQDAKQHAEDSTVPEGVVTDEIRQDLAELGWFPIDEE